MQQEFPNEGVRTGAQLFSFKDDNFPSKPAGSSKFDSINTKWFYTQFGDSTGTGGRAQDIIPLQDAEGRILDYGGGSKENTAAGADGSEGKQELGRNLQAMRELMEGNAAQIKSLAEIQINNQHRMEKLESLVEENSKQIKALTEFQSADQDHAQNGTENDVKNQIEALGAQHAKAAEQLRQVLQQLTKASEGMTQELQRQRQKGQVQDQNSTGPAATTVSCSHNVKPPPRKLYKQVIGFDYGPKTAAANAKAGFAKGLPPPSSRDAIPKANGVNKKGSTSKNLQ